METLDNNMEFQQPLYYNAELLGKPTPPIYRANISGKRYYFMIDKKNNMVREGSVTSILGSVMPKNEYLIKWIAELGYDAAMRKVGRSADYGTLEHICLSQYLVHGRFDLGTLPIRIAQYKAQKRIDYDTYFWKDDLAKDMASWDQFCKDHDVRPVAISLMLMSSDLGYAGELDLVCTMTIGTGQNGAILKGDYKVSKDGTVEDKRQRIIALIDWKSGKNGFYAQHEAQLHMYKALWDEYYPNTPIDKVYNWASKAWDESPTYSIKDQTFSPEQYKIPHYVALFDINERTKEEKKFIEVSGILELGKNNNNIRIMNFEERIRKIKKFDPPAEEPEPEPAQVLKELVPELNITEPAVDVIQDLGTPNAEPVTDIPDFINATTMNGKTHRIKELTNLFNTK